jgi:hypothetical protein
MFSTAGKEYGLPDGIEDRHYIQHIEVNAMNSSQHKFLIYY